MLLINSLSCCCQNAFVKNIFKNPGPIISVFSILTPYLIKIAVDEYLANDRYEDFIVIIVLMIANLILYVLFMFFFGYFANLLGQNVVFDLRTKLFKHIIDFKMGYLTNLLLED